MAVNDYTPGDLIAPTRATVKSWRGTRPQAPIFLAEPGIPQDIPPGGVYRFVESVEAAYDTAQELAGDKDIYITGADVAQQFLKRGLIEEFSIHLVPVLFGSGTRLFGQLNSHNIPLEIIDLTRTPEAIHLRFRVIGR